MEATPVVQSTGERNARFPNPLPDQRVFNKGTGNTERWDQVQGAWVTDALVGASAFINITHGPAPEGLIAGVAGQALHLQDVGVGTGTLWTKVVGNGVRGWASVSNPAFSSNSNFYVSSTGGTGAGTVADPWSLVYALSGADGRVLPGDTVWLRGGTYTGVFTSVLTGTSSAPIVVQSYAGEQATINGRIVDNGAYTFYLNIQPWWVAASFGVFPGAEGYGASSLAGRGGALLRVTNLNDSGAGSLRAALTASGPRTVIFDVSGTIALTSDIAITNPFLTVAGETAPSPGITYKQHVIDVDAADVCIRHLRGRIGNINIPQPDSSNALRLLTGAQRVVIDHCSFSWAIDQNTAVFCDFGTLVIPDTTFSHCIISEPLNAGHSEDPGHAHALLIGGAPGVQNFSLLNCLLAHCYFRNPLIQGGTWTVSVNNYIYNPGVRELWASEDGDATHLLIYGSIIGNAGRGGPSSNPPPATRIRFYDSTPAGSRFYLLDNAFDGAVDLENNPPSILALSPPKPLPSPLTIRASSVAQAYAKANAGARPLDRDAVDIRVVNDVSNGTGAIINSQADVGGWPALANNTRVLSVPANHADVRPSGYTVLEEDVLFPQLAAVGHVPSKMQHPINPVPLTTAVAEGSASSAVTVSITPSPNALVVAWVITRAGTPAIPTLSGNGLTWVQIGTVVQGVWRLTAFRAMGAAPTPGAVTIDCAGNNQSAFYYSIVQFTGVDTTGTNGSGAVVQVATGNVGTGTSLSVSLAPISAPQNSVVAGFGHNAGEAAVPGTGWTKLAEAQSPAVAVVASEWRAMPTVSADMSWTTSALSVGLALELKPLAG